MLDLSQFTEIAKKEAYPVILDSYDSGGSPVYEQLVEVIDDTDPEDIAREGIKGTTALGMGRPKVRVPGQEIEEDRPGEGYTWYLHIHQLARSLGIPFETLPGIEARIGSYISKMVGSWGETFKAEEETRVANVFMKGTLTAGSQVDFDGSFVGQADPYPKYIYDGLPFFDGAHTQAAGSSTFSNISTSLALSAANLQTVFTTVSSTNAKNERGEVISIRPDVLVVAPGQEFVAKTILNSVNVPGSGNNDVNVANGLLRPITWRYLTDDATQWIVGQAGKGIRVLRSPIQVVTWDDPSRRMRYVAALRHFGVGVTNWRYWYSADKADS